MGSLSKEEQDYVKTARVLLGHSLYSDSWLQLEFIPLAKQDSPSFKKEGSFFM